MVVLLELTLLELHGFNYSFSSDELLSRKAKAGGWRAPIKELVLVAASMDDNHNHTILVKTTTIKLCIKATAYVHLFNFCLRAFIQVWLLFQGGLHARCSASKTRKSGLAHVQWRCNIVNVTIFVSNVNKSWSAQSIWHVKGVAWECSPAKTTLSCHFQLPAASPSLKFKLQLMFECDLCATWVWRKCSFYLSAASTVILQIFGALKFR